MLLNGLTKLINEYKEVSGLSQILLIFYIVKYFLLKTFLVYMLVQLVTA